VAQRAYKPSIRQGRADECDGGVKVVSAARLINKCIIFVIKKKPKQKKISGLNTVLHLVPNESLLTGAWRRCKGNLRAAVITELLQIAVLSCLLPPGSQTSIYLLGLSPVRVEGSQLPLSLCHTWY